MENTTERKVIVVDGGIAPGRGLMVNPAYSDRGVIRSYLGKDVREMSDEELKQFRDDAKKACSALKSVFIDVMLTAGRSFAEFIKGLDLSYVEDSLLSNKEKRLSRRRRRVLLRKKYPELYKE